MEGVHEEPWCGETAHGVRTLETRPDKEARERLESVVWCSAKRAACDVATVEQVAGAVSDGGVVDEVPCDRCIPEVELEGVSMQGMAGRHGLPSKASLARACVVSVCAMAKVDCGAEAV